MQNGHDYSMKFLLQQELFKKAMALAIHSADFSRTSFHHESLKAFNISIKLFQVVNGFNWTFLIEW